ncbi:MAG TPA: DUF6458 family protein [Streptosporangiaceae bacterium]|nr:DUF6458 family protein [Streptosporangiaceae bacterium]
MRTATGLFLIALGAILAFAVQGHPSWLNIQVVGWVIMLTGVAGMAIPRRSYGWLRRRMVLRRGPGGRPVVDRVEEKHYPPYMMLNPGGNGVVGDAAEGTAPMGGAAVAEDVPTVVGRYGDPDPAGPIDDPGTGPGRLAADREAVVERAQAEWEAAENAARPGDPVPAEEVVEQYVEE